MKPSILLRLRHWQVWPWRLIRFLRWHVSRSCLGLSINDLTHVWHFSLVGSALCFGAFVKFPVLCFPASCRVCVAVCFPVTLFTWLLGQVSGFSLLSRYIHCSATSHCFAAPAVLCMLPCWVQFSPFVLS